ncbi:hypothetical protein GCM10010219_21190 [Streptomyces netropsis]|nr:hypothetical protein GCM10010219_21190 [Streptomyces netropsis]
MTERLLGSQIFGGYESSAATGVQRIRVLGGPGRAYQLGTAVPETARARIPSSSAERHGGFREGAPEWPKRR